MKNLIEGVMVAFIGGFLLFLVTELIFPTFVPTQLVPPNIQQHANTNSPTATPEPTVTPTSEPPTATPSPTATSTSEPPTPTPSPTATSTSEPVIPPLKAQVNALRFYESAGRDVPFEERVYAQRFASDTTRYINWELDIDYPALGRPIEFEITEIWYQNRRAS